MLPWFKADTEEVFGGVMTFDWPCPAPKHLALIELQAIMLGPKPELWTHEKLAKRFNRPVSWVRALRREAGIKQAISSGQTEDKQGIDSKQTGSRQETDSKQTGIKQAFSLHTAENQTSVSSKQADDRQAVDRKQAGSRQTTDSHQADVKQPSCARASLDSRSEKETENESEKNQEPPTPCEGDSVVCAPTTKKPRTKRSVGIVEIPESITIRNDAAMWSEVYRSLKEHERASIDDVLDVWAIYQATYPRVKAVDVAGYRAMARIRGIYSLEEIAEAVKGIAAIGDTTRGNWVYSSGAHIPKKLFAEGGWFDQSREFYHRQNRPVYSATDSNGRAQWGLSFTEQWEAANGKR